jgi:hypothetical protein
MLEESDHEVRGALTRKIAALGHAPTNEAFADEIGLTKSELEGSFKRLHAAHALLLHPHACRPWVVHPFALSAGSCWVQTPVLGYWANCLYCAFGIAAALRSDAQISTRRGSEALPVTYAIRGGAPEATTDIFHFSTPVARWWDNVIFTCASFQPFETEAEIDIWCRRHALPRGASLSIPALWEFARDWYGSYLQRPWRKRAPEEVRLLFARHGLAGSFWEI